MGTLDIHVAADRISDGVLDLLKSGGFHRDDFRPGDAAVVRRFHFVKHPDSIEDLNRSWSTLIAAIRSRDAGEFVGFVESEVTPEQYRATFTFKSFDAAVAFPFEAFGRQVCPLDAHKAFDVHVIAALETLDPRLDDLLQRAGFYVVDIVKGSQTSRCYTIQPLEMSVAPLLFDRLHQFFERAGGFQGKMKIEVAKDLVRFPSNVDIPPVVGIVKPRLADGFV